MLPGKRATRVGDLILREIADVILRRVKDPRLRGATLTGISLSNDMKYAKVYYSTIGGEKAIVEVQAGLDSAKGFIKRQIGFRMELKYIPDIVFMHDTSLEKGQRMEKILQELKE